MQKILIIQTAFIGDVILATPLIGNLKTEFPEAKIDFLVKNGNQSLLKNDPNLKDIPGFLMQYNLEENGMSMTMTVKLVLRTMIEDSFFEIPPGYQLVTEEELNRILMVMQNER